MAQVVENKAARTTEAKKPLVWAWSFPLASIIGAVYLWLGIILVHHLIPELWNVYVASWFEGNMILGGALKLATLAAVTGGLVIIWPKFMPRMDGLSGGVFLMAIAGFMAAAVWWMLGHLFSWVLSRWASEDWTNYLGWGLLLALAAGEIVWLYRWAKTPRFRTWAETLQEQGWFAIGLYKKGQGIWLRRLTMIGIILLLAAGVWHYTHFHLGGSGEWHIRLPFAAVSLCFVRMPRLTLSLLVLGLGSWWAWRLVNYPRFADFLVSAENEMVKVYWPSWRSLSRDTVVVLVTMILLAIFLYMMDVVWTLILSQFLGVLGT
ncbi:MAG: preprotein translocase subunit SecE [Gemmatales bacterium]|nr:preprotein translocase subunit SecE [Gemmatales bacterium]MCS7159500.1 preprotein translocase subunit SecE [Gemmatales bacterium]MDW8174699.1 preprotein translocase subunit SecE [Gemmatales bacterium]MDW8223596.1 preprotein translocase subunit SecE [Gemmatales bacterium]